MLSPQQDPPADKAPLLQGADEEEFEEEPLDRTAIDPYGRRSMAFRVKKTGQIITRTGKQSLHFLLTRCLDWRRNANEVLELTEAMTRYQPMRNYLRRLDRGMVFMHWKGVQFKSPLLNKTLAIVGLPFIFLYMFGYCFTRLMIDRCISGPPRDED
jgi:hypothetical protein